MNRQKRYQRQYQLAATEAMRAQAQLAAAQAAGLRQQQYHQAMAVRQQQYRQHVAYLRAQADAAPITCDSCGRENTPRSAKCEGCAAHLEPNRPVLPPPWTPPQRRSAWQSFKALPKFVRIGAYTLVLLVLLLFVIAVATAPKSSTASAAHDRAVQACNEIDAALRPTPADPRTAIRNSGAATDASIAGNEDPAYAKLYTDISAYTGGSPVGLAAIQVECQQITDAPAPPR
ncbi:hypothetical protein [Nocardia aurantia]|uniref:hypothetical protein n=1 Tax=Nocardia aurantia TaxID=2585199 RepID=UPI001295DC4D|nr:hypothetical protein [Nocardia aurantia]